MPSRATIGSEARALARTEGDHRMSPDQQIERSMLDGKDREQLHTIAGAVGVKGATRMRKADLIEAILATANDQPGNDQPGSDQPGNDEAGTDRAANGA